MSTLGKRNQTMTSILAKVTFYNKRESEMGLDYPNITKFTGLHNQDTSKTYKLG